MFGESCIRLRLLKRKYDVDLLIRISILINSNWASPPRAGIIMAGVAGPPSDLDQ